MIHNRSTDKLEMVFYTWIKINRIKAHIMEEKKISIIRIRYEDILNDKYQLKWRSEEFEERKVYVWFLW